MMRIHPSSPFLEDGTTTLLANPSYSTLFTASKTFTSQRHKKRTLVA